MGPFAESEVCKSRAHCQICRDVGESGHAWRSRQAALRVVPENWDCPFDVQWNEGALYQIVPTPRPIPVIHEGQGEGCCGG